MSETTSTARVATDRYERYGKQLTSHMARRCQTTWDETTNTGSIIMADGQSRATLTCEPGFLTLTLTAPAGDEDRLEDVIGRHLVRFGRRDELVAQWTRSDGTPGTRQEKPEEAADGE